MMMIGLTGRRLGCEYDATVPARRSLHGPRGNRRWHGIPRDLNLLSVREIRIAPPEDPNGMYDIKLRYLASVFLDAESITPQPDHITGLLRALQDDSFLPMAAAERVGTRNVRRIGLTADGGWTLILARKRFDLSLLPTDERGENVGDFGAFCEAAGAKLSATLEHFGRRAHRVAAVREGLLREMADAEMDVIAQRLLNLPGTFGSNIPFEWDWRAASHVARSFAGLDEMTNTVITIKRVAGSLTTGEEEETDFDRIRVDIDVNTIPTNTTERFGGNEVMEFFSSVVEWQRLLEGEMIDFVPEVLSEDA